MDVFFNPIFTRESNPRISDTYLNEKMTFQPTSNQEEKLTFNPKSYDKISPKDPEYYHQADTFQNKDLILNDMSMQSSSLNNTSMLSVNHSKMEKNFFKNPLFLDNSIQKKPANTLYFEQDNNRKDYYPAYQDYINSTDRKKEEEYQAIMENDNKGFELQMVNLNTNSLDISNNQSGISIPHYINPEFDKYKNNSNNYGNNFENSKNYEEFKYYANNSGTLNIGTKSYGNNLNNSNNYGGMNVNNYDLNNANDYNSNKNYDKNSNKIQNNYDNTKTYASDFQDKDIFKRTAEFQDLGFSENKQSNLPTGYNNLQEIQEKSNQDISKSYEINEQSVLLDVSCLKDKVITTLSKYKEHLTNPEKERKKSLDNDYQNINKDFSVIMEKYSNLNGTHVTESGFLQVSNSNLSYLKTGGPKENEINNMMELVQEFLEKFQPKIAISKENQKQIESISNNKPFSIEEKKNSRNFITNEEGYSFEPKISKKFGNDYDKALSSVQDQKNSKNVVKNQAENYFEPKNSMNFNKKDAEKDFEQRNPNRFGDENMFVPKNSMNFKKNEVDNNFDPGKINYINNLESKDSINYKINAQGKDFEQKNSKNDFFEQKNSFEKSFDKKKRKENIKTNFSYKEQINDNNCFQEKDSKDFMKNSEGFIKKPYENTVKPLKPLFEKELEKIDEMKKQRKNDELEQSFLTIKNNITAFDLDRTKNYNELSYLSEVSMMVSVEKSQPKQMIYIKKSFQNSFYGFRPKKTRFLKLKDELILKKEDFVDFDLICEKCDGVFKGFAWQKHRVECNNYRMNWKDRDKKNDRRENEGKVLLIIKKLAQKIAFNQVIKNLLISLYLYK